MLEQHILIVGQVLNLFPMSAGAHRRKKENPNTRRGWKHSGLESDLLRTELSQLCPLAIGLTHVFESAADY